MAKKSPIEKLDQAIFQILTEYSDEINTNMDIVVTKVCAQGSKSLRAESSAKFKGNQYSKSWKYKTEKGRLYTEGIIYNEKYSLPHLLEYGHALVRGGRKIGEVSGREHIAPVAEKLVTDFEKEVRRYL